MSVPTSPARAARLTAPGRSAVAVIQIDGAPEVVAAAIDRAFTARNGREWCAQPLEKLLYGRWGQEHAEDVVACRLSPQRSEIQCHGGDAAVNRILHDLSTSHVTIVPAEGWLSTIADVLEQELQTALSLALTVRTANLIAEQAAGRLRAEYERLHELSHPDLSHPNLSQSGADRAELFARLSRLRFWSRFGLHLTQPWSVVLTGRPNAGKSSLINALLGFQRAIVSAQPGTTRDVVTGITAFQGWPIKLSDTAGLRVTEDLLESAGIARARQQLQTADLVIQVRDISRAVDPADNDWLQQYPDLLPGASPELIVVANKCDQTGCWEPQANWWPVSALTGTGLAELQQEIERRLVPLVPPAGTAIPLTARQVALLDQMEERLQEDPSADLQDLAARLIAGG